MDKVRKPNISVCYTPSSEPYSIYTISSVRAGKTFRALDRTATVIGQYSLFFS
jgi:hypothetical protein